MESRDEDLERLEFILNQCGAMLIVHEVALADRVPDGEGCPALRGRVAVGEAGDFADLLRHGAIDMANEVWLVPATDAKNLKPNPHFLNEAALWILRQNAGKVASEYVFANPETGKPYTTITRVWYRIRKKAGINPKARIHDLRHSWAHRVLAQGHSIAELQMAMHHADPRTTMLYSHASPRMMKQVAGSASLRLEEPQKLLMIEAP